MNYCTQCNYSFEKHTFYGVHLGGYVEKASVSMVGIRIYFFTEELCPPEEYLCTGGSCIPSTAVCDGFMDCPDNADELNCSK